METGRDTERGRCNDPDGLTQQDCGQHNPCASPHAPELYARIDQPEEKQNDMDRTFPPMRELVERIVSR